MKTSWQDETGHLAIRWSEVGKRAPYDAPWMQETPEVPSGHLMPVPDFASRSRFGGASWFQPWSPSGSYRHRLI
jgi:hypothetical protein